MSFGGTSDSGSGAARQDRKAAREKRDAEAEALRLENERADVQALDEKQSLADKELARKKKQKQLTALGTDSDDDATTLLG